MNNFEAYLVELLQGHITYNGNLVEVVKHFSNDPNLPCITLDLSGGVTTDYYYYDYVGVKELLCQHCTSHININLWCNTEQERQSITGKILGCFHKEKAFHYTYCSQYDEGVCLTGGNCKVGTVTNARTAKNKCPDPDTYNYESLRAKHGIIDNTIRVESPFDMDEYDRHPPLLRSVIRCNAEYESVVSRAGVRVEEIVISEQTEEEEEEVEE